MQPSTLDTLFITPTYVEDEVAQEAQDFGIPAEGRVSDNEYLQRMADLLNTISNQLQYQQSDDIDATVVITSSPITLSTRGRKYTNVLMGGNSNQQINIFVPGVGNYLTSLQPGWNTLGAPDRSDIYIGPGATLASISVRLRYSNVQYGTVIL